MTNQLIQKAEEILTNAELVTLTSITENGYPRTVTMCSKKTEGVRSIWFATYANSTKVQNFKRNCKAGVCYSNLTMLGDIRVIDDADIKKELWGEWLTHHFPLGVSDPNYCVLKFETKYFKVTNCGDDSMEEMELDESASESSGDYLRL